MIYINSNKVKKLKKQISTDNIYVALDFDRTMTTGECLDSWASSANVEKVGKELVEKIDKLYEMYRPIEQDYNISENEKEKHMEKWYRLCMDLYYKHNLTKEKLEDSVKLSNLEFREGVKQFLEKTHKKRVPIVILSAGIGNVIEQFLKNNNCLYNNIYIISNFIKFNKEGKMIPFGNNIIHTLNKNMKNNLNQEILEKIQNKRYSILIGDTIEDEKIINEKEWQYTLKIGILNTNIQENLEIYNKHFDIVLTQKDASFKIINNIIFEK